MNYGFLSVLPSLLAIVLALATKNVFLALLASLLFGNLLLADFSIIGMLIGTKEMVVNVFSSSSSASIIIILTLLGGMFYMIVGQQRAAPYLAILLHRFPIRQSFPVLLQAVTLYHMLKTQLPYTLCFAAAACVLYLVIGFIL